MTSRTACRLIAVVLMLGAATACSAAPPDEPGPTTRASIVVPEGGVTLAEVGVRYGPDGFSVPRGLVVAQVIDQTNVVTMVMDAEQGGLLYDYLSEHLDEMGFVIEGQSPDSLYFTVEGWEGAYTQANGVAGLTLRADPGSFETP